MKTCVFLAMLTASAAAQAPTRIEIGVIPGALRFDVSRFDVRGGVAVEINFTNNGLMPHNLLVVRPGRCDAVMLAAMALGAEGQTRQYVPQSDDVLAATRLVQPGKSELLRFTLSVPGDYGYVCTFPGHGTIMRGVLRARASGMKLEPAVRHAHKTKPPQERRLASTSVTPLPLGTRKKPFVIRTFMPDPGLDAEVLAWHARGHAAHGYDVNSGRDRDLVVETIDGLPAAIGVNFGPAMSYCWDTVECRMMYAWTGGFLDMSAYWGAKAGGGRKKYDYVPRLRGTLIHTTSGPHPLAAHGAPRFVGYRLDDGVPEFSYRIGPYTVRERITPGDAEFEVVCSYVITSDGAQPSRGFDLSWFEQMKVTHGQVRAGRITFTGRIRGALQEVEVVEAEVVERAGVVRRARRVRQGHAPEVNGDIVGLTRGVTIFRDRDYVFQKVPRELIGADYIATYNEDKSAKASVSWTVEFESAARVFLLLDSRVTAPQWMSVAWQRTSLRVKTSGNWSYGVYQVDVDAGAEITLGPQTGGSFYAIAAQRRDR